MIRITLRLHPVWACLAVLLLFPGVHGDPGDDGDRSNSPTVPALKGLQPQLLKVPAGFNITVWQAGLPKARTITSTKVNGSTIVYVGSVGTTGKPKANVYYIVDKDSDGKPDLNGTLLSDVDTPNGVVVQGSDLLVSGFEDGKGMVWRLANAHGYALQDKPFTGNKSIVTDRLPGDAWHGRRVLRFSPDGLLVLAVGAPCNVCQLNRTANGIQFGSLYSLNTKTGELKQLATGVRNSVGFDWHPQTGELYFTDNGRDKIGNDRPDCELNRIPSNPRTVTAFGASASADVPSFGFPYCQTEGLGNPYERDLGGGVPLPDPDFNPNNTVLNCSAPNAYLEPVQALGPHTAPLGMRFYRWSNTSGAFPREYDNTAFIAEHGSWNRAAKIGYRVMMLRVDNRTNQPAEYEPFASGWLQNEGKPESNFTWGRPVDVEQLPDGSLLISDDETGALYRATYTGSNSSTTAKGSTLQGPGSGAGTATAAGAGQASSAPTVRLAVWYAVLACAAVAGLALLM